MINYLLRTVRPRQGTGLPVKHAVTGGEEGTPLRRVTRFVPFSRTCTPPLVPEAFCLTLIARLSLDKLDGPTPTRVGAILTQQAGRWSLTDWLTASLSERLPSFLPAFLPACLTREGEGEREREREKASEREGAVGVPRSRETPGRASYGGHGVCGGGVWVRERERGERETGGSTRALAYTLRTNTRQCWGV